MTKTMLPMIMCIIIDVADNHVHDNDDHHDDVADDHVHNKDDDQENLADANVHDYDDDQDDVHDDCVVSVIIM